MNEVQLCFQRNGFIVFLFKYITVCFGELINEFFRKVCVNMDKRRQYAQAVEKKVRAHLILQCIKLRERILFLKLLRLNLHITHSNMRLAIQYQIKNGDGNDKS